ncbi:hypothetical protein CSOJ01_01450 [Colletotrichum sojae]|uniref:Uncharacterized protein n=1 Tax=Colletotrichum sojae TaxID=2175907 RepID=A0A8H6N4L4_9PEZI|nr:hypothetical protein CSOJ01_01450 [Colletotrichum sojae]
MATYRWEDEVEAKAGEPDPEDDIVGDDGRRAGGSWSTTDLERGFAEAIRSAMDYAMRQGPLGALLAVGRKVYVDAIAKVTLGAATACRSPPQHSGGDIPVALSLGSSSPKPKPPPYVMIRSPLLSRLPFGSVQAPTGDVPSFCSTRPTPVHPSKPACQRVSLTASDRAASGTSFQRPNGIRTVWRARSPGRQPTARNGPIGR